MSYDSDETSQQGSRPEELWKIVTTSATYRYTTSEEDIVFALDGQTYTAIAAARSDLAGASISDPPELTLTLPTSTPVVQDNAFGMPPAGIRLTVYRIQTGGAYAVVWEGEITDFSVTGKDSKIRAPSSLADPFDASIPSAYVQRLCNHVLYDSRCAINRASAAYHKATTVVSVAGRTVVVTSLGAWASQFARYGEIVLDSNTSERRLILSQVGTTLIINAPFHALAATNPVTVYAGCDHTIDGAAGCVPKFANGVNFGGHPFLPPNNPWRGMLRGKPWS